jgi:hypothetical protein
MGADAENASRSAMESRALVILAGRPNWSILNPGASFCFSHIFPGCAARSVTKDNDPHGEHDFGSFDLAGVSYFFEIDYCSPDMEGGSEDPADPEKTTRVLTIMRADEY